MSPFFQYKIVVFIFSFCLFCLPPIAWSSSALEASLVPDLAEKLHIISEPSIQEHLSDRSLGRPHKCPLRSEPKLSELFARLTEIGAALKYGACYNRNKEVVDGLSTLITDKNQLAASMLPPVTVVAAPPAPNAAFFSKAAFTPTASYYDQRRIFDVLSSVAQDEDCVLNIKQRGLLPVLADVVTNMGLVASVMPTPNGLLLGAGGMSLGATLRVINGLFKSPFAWDEAKDRSQFIELNCAFFDLRREIEAAEIIDYRDGAIEAKIARAEQALKRLRVYLQLMQSERQTAMQALAAREASYLEARLGPARVALLSALEKLLVKLAAIPASSSLAQVAAVHAFMAEFPLLASLIEQQRLKPAYLAYLLDLMQQFKWQGLSACNELELKEFQQKYFNPLSHYLSTYAQELRGEQEEERKAFYSLASKDDSNLNNKKIQEKVFEVYEKIITTLQTTINRIETRIQILKAKDRKFSFDAFDDGAQTTYNILVEYQFIQDILYGKLGYSYIKYFRKQIKTQHDDFIRHFERFYRRYFNLDGSFRKDKLVWSCRDANQLRVIWESANASAEVANDFIETNGGISHNHVKVFDTFLGVFPSGYTSQYKLRNSIRGAELAKEILEKKRPYKRREMRRSGGRAAQNLGEIMLNLRSHENKREQIENFWQKNHCARYL